MTEQSKQTKLEGKYGGGLLIDGKAKPQRKFIVVFR